MNRDYSREDVQVATKHMRKHSTFLVVKLTVKSYLTPTRIDMSKKLEKTSVDKDVEKSESLQHS